MTRQTRKSKHKHQIRKPPSKAPAFVNLLPVDVLIKFFSWVKILYEKEFSGRKRVGWIAITHVCQLWRDAALASGTLWNTIYSGNPDVAEWLKRAGGSDLFVDLELVTVADEAALILVLPKLAQIQSLSIEIADSITTQMNRRIWSQLQTISSNAAPLLESFKFVDKKQDNWPYFHFFADHAPALRKFTIVGCTPRIPSPCFQYLTTFCLYNAYPPINKFMLLAQLGQMPCLECLILMRVIVPTEQSMDAIPNIPVTRLPKLKHITLFGNSLNTDLDFLSRLSLEGEPSVRFVSSMMTPDFSAFPRFIDTYTQVMQNPIKFARLDVEWADKTLKVKASPTLDHPDAPDPPTLALELRGPWEDSDLFPIEWGDELERLPLDSLRSLYLDCEIGEPAWASLSKKCPVLDFIWVAGLAAYEFVNYFIDDWKENCPSKNGSPHVKDHDEDGPAPKEGEPEDAPEKPVLTWAPVLPSLDCLEIVNLDFEGCHPMVESLNLTLQYRAGYASTIYDIYITDCYDFDEEMLTELRNGATIHLDGETYPAPWAGDDEEVEIK